MAEGNNNSPEKVSNDPQVQSQVEVAKEKYDIPTPTARDFVAQAIRNLRNRERFKKSSELSLMDHLTELPNLRAREQRMKEETARMVRNNTRSSLMKLDVNNLKILNDNDPTHHTQGDSLLRTMAQVLRESIRIEDFAARVGGDEFDVIFSGATPEQVETIWNERFLPGFTNAGISVGAGVAEINPADTKGTNINADSALFQAKKATKVNIPKGQPATESLLTIFNSIQTAA